MKRYLRLPAEAKILMGSFGFYALLLWPAPVLALAVSIAILLATISLALARVACALAAKPTPPSTRIAQGWGDG
jgi:hypothetical protein